MFTLETDLDGDDCLNSLCEGLSPEPTHIFFIQYIDLAVYPWGHTILCLSQRGLSFKLIFLTLLVLHLTGPCTGLGRRPVAFENSTLQNNQIFSSSVSQEHSD